MEIERRDYQTRAEVRATGEGKARGIRGMAAVTNSLSQDLGGFKERIAPGAFDEALQKSDVRGLFNHNPDIVLGRSGGTMDLRATEEGLEYDIPELPKSRADVLEAIERGDVTGNSFAFTVAEDSWDEMDDGTVVRTITRFGELFDVGPVTYPAYKDTVVAQRCRKMADGVRRNRRKWAERKQRLVESTLDA